MDRPSKAIVCSVCSKWFFSELNYSIHCRGHSADRSSAHFFNAEACVKNTFSNDQVEKAFQPTNELPNSTNVQHENEVPQSLPAETFSSKPPKGKEYICGVCKGCFSPASTFKKHYLTHMKEEESPAGGSCNQPGVLDSSEKYGVVNSPVSDEPVELPSEIFIHTCKICQDKFPSNIELLVHSRSHAKKDTFTCSTCGKVFYRKATFVIHQSSHIVKKIFSCKACKIDFSSKLLLSVHEQTHLINEPLSCKICALTFPDKVALIEHYREHKAKKARCEFCGKCFSNDIDLKSHLAIHIEDSAIEDNYINYSCDKCEKTFPSKELLKTHQLFHVGSVDIFPCSECEKVFASLKNLKNHEIKDHKGIDVRNYSCDKCEAKFVTKGAYRNHYAEHINPENFRCSICGEIFKNKNLMFKHKRLNHRSNESFSCSECPNKYRNKKTLMVHVQSHFGRKPFACNSCDKSYTQRANLIRHRMIHLGKKPFVCTICDKRFVRNDFLKTHIRMHTGEKPFMCESCGLCYATNKGLKAHLARHAGDAPINHRKARRRNDPEEVTVLGPNHFSSYTCNVCGKNLFSERTYQLHMQKHQPGALFKCDHCNTELGTEISLKLHMYRKHVLLPRKDFACSYCEKKFSTSAHLYRHQYMHTGEKLFECEICQKRFTAKVNLSMHLKNKVCLRNPKNVENDLSESND